MRSDREPGGAYAFPDDPQYAGGSMWLRYGISALSGRKGGAGCSGQRGVCVKRAGFKRHRSVQDGGNSLSGERRQTGSGCGIC